ncbi:HipA domain-containing protein [Pseudomonas fluorescens]|uniref:type II toxin-antitoxin system HipA family toxin n=1 Tax=Pseudomonas fluorescens TaxID=294 RepID=UPI0021CDF1C8|nr:HipA domain-containing protein [Pseudomonas fluorescens]UXV19733.1 HipA domain-containing protein [Pseudomonas fluorescens]
MQTQAPYSLMLQIFNAGHWHDAMRLEFSEPQKGFDGVCRFHYRQEYLVDNLESIQQPFCNCVSARFPLEWDVAVLKSAPAFLHDIAPAGAAKRFLMKRIGREKPQDIDADLFLLGRSTPAPIGNMRIKESVQALEREVPVGFTRHDVISRDNSFLEYAYEQGAAIGGATGAGGEAPKLLMTQSRDGLLYPDAILNDDEVAQHWFIKFARNQATQNDQDILRSEYHYYKALQALGIETVASEGLALEEATKPSLWMHRFDRRVGEGGVERLAVESIYSLAGVTTPGSYMDHLEVIRLLVDQWRAVGQEKQVAGLVAEYLRRDLLNKVLGNSDNHGRNTSIIRECNALRLAPLYDLAPMVMDAEAVTRTTKWPKALEVAGDINWKGVCDALVDIVDPEQSFERLRQDAEHLRALPDFLVASGLPAVTLNHPSIPLGKLDLRLKQWGLR